MGSEEMADELAANGTAWRLNALEEWRRSIDRLEPAVLSERITHHANDMNELRDEIKSLRRALYAFSFSVATASVVFAIGVLQVVR